MDKTFALIVKKTITVSNWWHVIDAEWSSAKIDRLNVGADIS